MVSILESIYPDSSLTLSIVDGSFSIPEAPAMTFEEEMEGTLPLIACYSESEIQILQQMNQTSAAVIQNLASSSNGFSLLGATYLISSLFTFLNVILLFNFLSLKWVLTPYKVLFNTVVTIFFLVFLENLLTNDNGRKPSNFTKASFTKRMPTFKS